MRIVLFFLLMISTVNLFAQELPLHLLKLPPGFHVEVFADHVRSARQMTLGAKGTLFIGSFAGNVYAIPNALDSNNKKKIVMIAIGLNKPNGVAFYKGALYVAEIHRILRYDNIEEHLAAPPKPIVVKNLPSNKWHGWRYIKMGPDNKLYISIGSPCNICLLPKTLFGTIVRMNVDGTQFEVFARGIRNSVGFDWNPISQSLWFTDNGADMMGDDIPPDELNHAPTSGLHFGFPYYHGRIADPKYSKLFPVSQIVFPMQELPAHVAALGMKFYHATAFPKAFQQLFIAEHGSWNRSSKAGYQVIRVTINDDKVVNFEPFVSGWLQGQQVWGRPVDILIMPDGSMLISDDYADVIYRIFYTGR